jgi:hypothetical protein
MGDGAQIILCEYPNNPERDIYLYAHWGGDELPKTLANALDRGRNRWDDPSYLNRIIFSEMIQEDVLGETGFGLSSFYQDSSPDTDWRVIYNDCIYGNCVNTPDGDYVTFEDFVKAYKE